MKVYLVHCGFYDPELCEGLYEGHVNFFVAAESFDDARAKAKLIPEFKVRFAFGAVPLTEYKKLEPEKLPKAVCKIVLESVFVLASPTETLLVLRFNPVILPPEEAGTTVTALPVLPEVR